MSVNRFGKAKLNWIDRCQYRLVQVKIVEEMPSYIFAHHDNSLVNVYDCTNVGVNDPYGVKVI